MSARQAEDGLVEAWQSEAIALLEANQRARVAALNLNAGHGGDSSIASNNSTSRNVSGVAARSTSAAPARRPCAL
jgi:hypothetical protein